MTVGRRPTSDNILSVGGQNVYFHVTLWLRMDTLFTLSSCNLLVMKSTQSYWNFTLLTVVQLFKPKGTSRCQCSFFSKQRWLLSRSQNCPLEDKSYLKPWSSYFCLFLNLGLFIFVSTINDLNKNIVNFKSNNNPSDQYPRVATHKKKERS